MAMMLVLTNIGTVILQGSINSFGTATITGHTAARKFHDLCILPLGTICTSSATFVSQHFSRNYLECSCTDDCADCRSATDLCTYRIYRCNCYRNIYEISCNCQHSRTNRKVCRSFPAFTNDRISGNLSDRADYMDCMCTDCISRICAKNQTNFKNIIRKVLKISGGLL